MFRKIGLIALLLLISGAASPTGRAAAVTVDPADTSTDAPIAAPGSPPAAAPAAASPTHRLIVHLATPSLAEWVHARSAAANREAGLVDPAGRLDHEAPLAVDHVRRLEAEQLAFVKAMRLALPQAEVATYIDELGARREHFYRIVFNGLAVDAGVGSHFEAVRAELLRLPGVAGVYRDLAHAPATYASLPLINAPAAWNHPVVGGQGRAGEGIRLASMDGGLHHAAPMFSGAGYSYPPGYPKGHTSNTNGKIIVSRAYFRSYDPPAPGDEKPWPGEAGTEHGVHTGSTAAGNAVDGTFWGTPISLSGVAPRAYVMSYRVFYASVQGIGSFYNAEGIASLEDVVRDGAHVVNNSWGGGPSSGGGEYDALDLALLNASRAGVFVSMSAGNAGPGNGTTDHPSGDYINVAATTTSGTYASGRLSADAPKPVPETLINLAYEVPAWGDLLPIGKNSYPYRPSAVDSTNIEGCIEWPAGTFDDRLALIRRGACEFGVKALNAEKAGAAFVIIYNSVAGGDLPPGMGAGAVGGQVTIPVISIGHANGAALADWYAQNPDRVSVEMDTVGYPIGNTPDRVAAFSSRGPGVGLVLKPDIAAPGVNIMAQGYDGSARGEARHLGFGQASGTSMASPHVAGAAALLRQIHPEWNNAAIKSALMSTSKYTDIYTADGQPAQPLDIGAGRMDLTRAADPGVILDPPSLSFGAVLTKTEQTLTISVTSVTRDIEMYTLGTVSTTGGFTSTTSVPGMRLNKRSITLLPGETKTFEVTWNAKQSGGYGDRQGYVLLKGIKHEAHLPAWMRVTFARPDETVLLIDNDGSSLPPEVLDAVQPGLTFKDYRKDYTKALKALGIAYDTYDADAQYDPTGTRTTTLPDPAWLERYDTIIYETGDFSIPDAANIIPGTTAPTAFDSNRLVEYVNGGGRLVAFGQDFAATFNAAAASTAPFLYSETIGAERLSDSVTGGTVLTRTQQLVTGAPGTPFEQLTFDLSDRGDGEGNQSSVDEIEAKEGRVGILTYAGTPTDTIKAGFVAMTNRDELSLERPGTTFAGRAIYLAFGLEGINDDTGFNRRSELLGRALDWSSDVTTAVITPTINAAAEVSYFEVAAMSTQGSPFVAYRMDFGDGSPITPINRNTIFGHSYARPGAYVVRAEATDALGTVALAEIEVYVPGGGGGSQPGRIYLPKAEK
jgi:subtilisin family serine protease